MGVVQCSGARFKPAGSIEQIVTVQPVCYIYALKYVCGLCVVLFTVSPLPSDTSLCAWPVIVHVSSPRRSARLLSEQGPFNRQTQSLAHPQPRTLATTIAHPPASHGREQKKHSRRAAVPNLPAQARYLLGRPLRLGDGPLHGLGAQPELLARVLLCAVGGVRGLALGGRGHGGPLVDGRAPGRYYPVDDVPLRLGRPPPAAYAHDVARPQRVVWVVDQVALEVLEVLFCGEGIVVG